MKERISLCFTVIKIVNNDELELDSIDSHLLFQLVRFNIILSEDDYIELKSILCDEKYDHYSINKIEDYKNIFRTIVWKLIF